jgi:hypothetical protein
MNLKLNINCFLTHLNKKKIFKNKIKKQTIFFNKKTAIKKLQESNFFFIKFIINLTIKKANTFIHVLDCTGAEKYFYSNNGLEKKFKNFNFNNQIEKFYKIITTKLKFLKNKPISMHINSVELNYKWFLRKISKRFFMVIIKFFNQYAHNGCKIKK